MTDHPRTRLLQGLAALALLLAAAGGAALALRRGAGPKAPEPPKPVVPVSQEVLSAPHEACVARLPRAPGLDTITITDFARASGDLRLTWTLTPTRVELPPEQRDGDTAGFSVRLDLSAGGASRGVVLGAHGGHPYAADITACRGVPQTGPCTYDPPPSLAGVIAELSVTSCAAWACSGGVRWMVVRTPAAALVLRRQTTDRPHADRQICAPGAWQVVVEIPLGPSVRVIEDVRLGDPPKPLDCAAFGDGRCTG